jgi:hypothetical protein
VAGGCPGTGALGLEANLHISRVERVNLTEPEDVNRTDPEDVNLNRFTGPPANDLDVSPPGDIRAEVDEMLDEVHERLAELDEAALLALWRVLATLVYWPHAGDGRDREEVP